MYHVRTVRDINKLLEEIDLVLEAMYKTKKPDPAKIADVEKVLDTAGISLSNEMDIRTFLEKLREDLKKLDRVAVTFAFEPSYDLIQKIYDQIRDAASSDSFVVETKVNPDLLGGVILSYKGKYKDLSLISGVSKHFAGAKKIDELF